MLDIKRLWRFCFYFRLQTKFGANSCFYSRLSFCSRGMGSWLPSMYHRSHDQHQGGDLPPGGMHPGGSASRGICHQEDLPPGGSTSRVRMEVCVRGSASGSLPTGSRAPVPPELGKRVVRILLEYFLVFVFHLCKRTRLVVFNGRYPGRYMGPGKNMEREIPYPLRTD